MSDAENRLGIAMRVGRVDDRFDHVVVHEAVDDIGAVALGRAEDRGIPEEDLVADIVVGADALSLSEIFVRVAGVQGIDGDFELLAITGGVGLAGLVTIDLREFKAVHEGDYAVIRRDEIFPRKVPTGGVVERILFDRPGDARHFPQADAATQSDHAGEENRPRNRPGVLLAQMGQAIGKAAHRVDGAEDFR